MESHQFQYQTLKSVQLVRFRNCAVKRKDDKMNHMQNGSVLRSDYYERVIKHIKLYYMPLRIFSTIVFMMSIAGLIGFVYSFLTDESYNSGLFAALPIFKWIMFGISMLFISALIFCTFKLMMLPVKKNCAVENGNFYWRYGRLTKKRRYKNQGSIWVDNERCLCLDLNIQEFDAAQVGDEFLLVYIGNKNPIKFAFKI